MPISDDESLERYFTALERESTFEVEATLKESPNELTQRVCFVGADATTRVPLIRKFIRRESGLGAAYERLHEAQTAGRRFKHAPLIWECYRNADSLVVVMELISGETLSNYVERIGASLKLAASVFPQICDAVSELHEDLDPPLIHRDLKPSNIIVAQEGLYVIDFGIARSFNEGARADTIHFGTCSFAPPEQFGFGQTTIRSDIFALGMMLFYCLAGSVPDTYVAAEDFSRENIPTPLQAVIMRACALSPTDRYANVRELKQSFLEAACTSAPVNTSHPQTPSPHIMRAPARTPATSSTTALTHGPSGNSAFAPSPSPLPDPAFEQGHTTGLHPVPARESETVENATRFQAPENRPEKARGFTLLGKIWNGMLIVAVAFLCAACVGAFVDPSGSTSQYPTWVNALGFLFFMPVFFVALAWTLFDKRRLTQRFPRLQRYRFWHWIGLLAGVTIMLFLGIGCVVSIGQIA